MKKLIIIGASGHGKVVADIANLNGYKDIVFLEIDDNIKECGGYPVVCDESIIQSMDADIIVAIGSASRRRFVQESVPENKLISLIHPSAIIARDVTMGKGTVIMAGTVINPGVKIGKGCIVNTCASIDHDCIIGDYVHVSVDSHLCGTVTVEDNTWIGAGSTIRNNISICKDCTIGAGAVVVKNINKSGTYIGVPAKDYIMKETLQKAHGGGSSIRE